MSRRRSFPVKPVSYGPLLFQRIFQHGARLPFQKRSLRHAQLLPGELQKRLLLYPRRAAAPLGVKIQEQLFHGFFTRRPGGRRDRTFLLKQQEKLLPSSVIDFFLSDFNDLKTKSYGEAISPIISFIDEMEMIPVFNQENNDFSLQETIQDNFLTIFSLDKTKLGDKSVKTISGLIMQKLLTLVQSYSFSEHIIFIVDEVAVVENPILSRFLSEARKYNLSLILASQYFNQVSDNLKDSIFANTINYYLFRVSRTDAALLVNHLPMKVPLEDTVEAKTKMLTELNNRECIIRINANGILLPAFKAQTMNFESIPRLKEKTIDSPISSSQKDNKKIEFSIGNTTNLKDILITHSSQRGGIKNE